jgi:hypothetical protein
MVRRRRRRTRVRMVPLGIVLALIAAAALVTVISRPWSEDAPAPVAAPRSASSTGAGTADAPSPTAAPSASMSMSMSASASASASPMHRASAKASASTAKAVAAPAGYRTVSFVNAVQQTIWVGAGEQTPQPALATTGWVLPAGQSLTITVPDRWNGRFWGRTGCSFNAAGSGHCQTGDCAGRFQCAQYGVIPATLAEFNFNAYMNLDFYDVSMVDGSNLPMYINIAEGATKDPISSTGCSAAGCTKPVDCPSALRIHAGGAMVGCESACGVFGTDRYCCRGQWAPRPACDPTTWPVDYAKVFKTAEPFAYSYVDDDATSTYTCGGECDYRITFGLSP